MVILIITVLLVLLCLAVAIIALLLPEPRFDQKRGIEAEEEISIENRWSMVEQGPDSLYPSFNNNDEER